MLVFLINLFVLCSKQLQECSQRHARVYILLNIQKGACIAKLRDTRRVAESLFLSLLSCSSAHSGNILLDKLVYPRKNCFL